MNRSRLFLAFGMVGFAITASAQSSRDGSIGLIAPVDSSSKPVEVVKAPDDFTSKINSSPLADGYDYNRVIVYYDDAGTRAADDIYEIYARLDAASRTSGASLEYVRSISTGGYLVEVRNMDARKSADAALYDVMAAFAQDSRVTSVEPDARMQPLLTPNDTRYGEQWHYSGTYGINAPLAWDVGNGTGVTVAVLDTGIANHSDLNANVVAGYDFVSNAASARDGNGRDSNPNDEGDWWTNSECGPTAPPSQNSSWHGTHVAGTIAAVTNNAKGVAGVAYGAKIRPVRVLAKCGGSLSDIADAITWSSGGTVSGVTSVTAAKVINMSLGGGGSCGTTYQNAINGAVSRGTVVIVAAGNSNINASNATPANCANVITVAATNTSGTKASFSNFGTVVDVAAPGTTVLSTLNSGTTTPSTESYASYQGTSMATPHVAGVAALVLGKCAKTPSELETLLKASVRTFGGTCSGCGTGIINARAAIDACGGGGGGGGGTSFFENLTDYTISDNTTVDSPISVTGRTGNAPSNLQVAVTILHTYRGDLQIDLVAPDGSLYRLKNSSSSDSADNVIATYSVNASSEVANGTWRLRVRDVYTGDTGRIDKWSLQF
jgi:serine protease